MHNLTTRKCTSLTLTVLLAALLLAAPVFADDGIVEIPAAGEAPLDGGAEQPTEEAVDLPAEGGAAPAQESELPEAENDPSSESPEEEVPEPETGTVPEALAEEDLALAAADGDTMDMACDESAQAIAGADPYFSVGSTKYQFYVDPGMCDPLLLNITCFENQGVDVIQDAIYYIRDFGTIPTDRKIYVESDSYSGNINFNGGEANLSTLNGLIGVYDPDTESRPDITGDISIRNLTNGFTFQGFTVNGELDFLNITGALTIKDTSVANPSGDGITVTNSKSHIVIEDVSASGNAGHGMYLYSGEDGKPYNLTIKNSYFDENDDGIGNVYGATIRTLGKITIDGISASRNTGAGLNIHSTGSSGFSSLSIKNAVLVSNDPEPDNSSYGFGLAATSFIKSNITLENIYASDSYQSGSEAVQVTTSGNVTIRNMQVIDNSGSGLTVNTSGGTGYVKIYDSRFNENSGDGLNISAQGLVLLSSVKANNNTNYGAQIYNCAYVGAVGACTGTGGITITSPKSYGVYGANEFSNNGNVGLLATSGKAILATNIIANDNGTFGAQLDNHNGSGNVTVNRNIPSNEYFDFYNSFSGNNYIGLEIDSKGAIRVDYANVNNNDYEGGHFQNQWSSTSPGVSANYSTFNENQDSGIYVESNGSITLTNVSASRNDFGGTNETGAVLNTTYGTSGNVTIKGVKGYVCQFNQNGYEGIKIYASGHIVLSNLQVNQNRISAKVHNQSAASAKNVSITNAEFNGITVTDGVEIGSKGNITFNNVSANGNFLSGVTIAGYYGTGGNVTIKNSTFDENGTGGLYAGLYIESLKNVSLYAVSASGNSYRGVWIDNCQHNVGCDGSGTVTINSGKNVYNTFNNNGTMGASSHHGVYIQSSGTVTLSNLEVIGNGYNGVNVDNNFSNVTGGITIKSGSNMRNTIQNNGMNGLTLTSNGAISVSNVDVFENSNTGMYAYNNYAGSTQPIKIKDSTFIKNLGYGGIDAASNGIITLQGVDCSDNSTFEGELTSGIPAKRDVLSATYGNDSWKVASATGSEAYTITVTSDFFDPYLEMYAADGELLDENDDGGIGNSAELTGTFMAIGDYYFVVRSAEPGGQGAYIISLNGGFYSATSHYGANLTTTAQGGIKIMYSSKMGFGARFNNNSYYGLNINTDGAVNLSKVESMYNGYYNLYIWNNDDLEQPVTLNTVTTEGSVYDGIYVNSRGNISLSKVTAINNGDAGAELYNIGALIPRTIKVSSSTFSENIGNDGLTINASGAVTVSSVVANNNIDESGVDIDNRSNGADVTITGKNNRFNDNDDYGLYILSNGTVSLTNFSANDNNLDGVYIDNDGGDPKDVKINSTVSKTLNLVENNGSEGMMIWSHGAVTINKVECLNNGASAGIFTNSAPASKKVTITNSTFRESSDTGLYILARGAVVLTNVWAESNSTVGIHIDNTSAPGESVTLTKVNANDNQANGVHVNTQGAILINTITANRNTQKGLELLNNAAIENVTIQNATINLNGTTGITLNSNGLVTLKTLSVSFNTQDGILLTGNNTSDLTLYKVDTVWNKGFGVRASGYINTNITLSNFVMNGTASVGGSGFRMIGNGTNIVTLNKSVALGNYGDGLEFQNIDTYTLINSLAFGNDIDGDGDLDINDY